jgi:hypothetical protein
MNIDWKEMSNSIEKKKKRIKKSKKIKWVNIPVKNNNKFCDVCGLDYDEDDPCPFH